MKDEALKLALEVMHNQGDVGVDEWIAAEAAIKQALAAPVEQVRLQCVHCGTVYADGVPPAVPAPVQEPVAWKWHQAPIKTSWGHDMVVADLAIDKDHTVSVYCERDQTVKVEAMFTPPAAQRQWVGLTDEELSEFDVDPVEAKAMIQRLKEKQA